MYSFSVTHIFIYQTCHFNISHLWIVKLSHLCKIDDAFDENNIVERKRQSHQKFSQAVIIKQVNNNNTRWKIVSTCTVDCTKTSHCVAVTAAVAGAAVSAAGKDGVGGNEDGTNYKTLLNHYAVNTHAHIRNANISKLNSTC